MEQTASTLDGDRVAEASERLATLREIVMKNPEYHKGVESGAAQAAAGQTMTLDELFRRLAW